jgi:hypothetical protein
VAKAPRTASRRSRPVNRSLSRQPAGKNTLTSASEASASQRETTKGMENAGKILRLKLNLRFYIDKELDNLIVIHRRPTAGPFPPFPGR